MKLVIYPDYDLWNFTMRSLKRVDDAEVYPLNRYCSAPQIALRKYIPNAQAPAIFLLGNTLRQRLGLLQDGDSIIVCEYMNVALCSAILKSLHAKVDLHLWFWNPVFDHEPYFSRNRDKVERMGFSIHTFDPDDAAKYNLKLHKQFFPISNFKGITCNCYWSDFYFLGFDKGRGNDLKELSTRLKSYNQHFILAKKSTDYITYDENIINILHTRCVVDIVQSNQDGFTLRPLEAIALKKKLLSNNMSLLETDFYNSENIFVIGHDDWNRIEDFLNTPFAPIEQNIIDSYDMLSWIKNF